MQKLETVEIELENGDLIQIPVTSLKTAWGRYCASRRETYSGGHNGSVTKEGYKKRLETLGITLKAFAFEFEGRRLVVIAYSRLNASLLCKEAKFNISEKQIKAYARTPTQVETNLATERSIWISNKHGRRSKGDYERII